MKIEVTQRNRSGRTIVRSVDPKARVEALNFIQEKFNRNPFLLKDYLYRKFSFLDKNIIARERQVLRRLAKNGWLSSHLNKNRELWFNVTKKFTNYEQNYGSFNNPDAPLMKPKEKLVYVEKEIEKKVIEKEVQREKVRPIKRV